MCLAASIRSPYYDNGSIRHVRGEGRLDGTPRGTVSGRGTEDVAPEGRNGRAPWGGRQRHTRAEEEEVLNVPPAVLNRMGSTVRNPSIALSCTVDCMRYNA